MADNDQTQWKKCNQPLLPVRLVNGKWSSLNGQMWRRRKPNGKLEYQQDEETLEEFYNRQW